ncbi:MAG TPA: type 1 glutamine amidotransferase [Chthoniobacteraceae bacterium]|nr:type 1 glutamine amidotransferase [Chthoniobacteraceae bacterium]
MNIHYLQHAATERPGEIANWAAAHGHKLSGTHWYRGDAKPNPAEIDFLVIMGGGMNIYEHRNHPWLVTEKELIGEVIEQGKPVLGVCLGSQLIADVMGGKVYQNPVYEIGWFPIRTLDAARRHPLFSHFPEEFTALHWHGDTFDLPPGATLLASSAGCVNQAFICQGNIVGLQFHIEVRPEDVRAFVQGETAPLPEGRYVQSFEDILAGDRYIPTVHKLLREVLDAMAAAAD